MQLFEKIKNFLTLDKINNPSSTVPLRDTIANLSNDSEETKNTSFFDTREDGRELLFSRGTDFTSLINQQKDTIQKYRFLAMNPDVSTALDEIVNEVIYTFDNSMPMKVQINEENTKIVKAIDDAFNKILNLGNIKKSLFHLVKSTYIDGQMIMHLTYDSKNLKAGIQELRLIDPRYFYFDAKKKVYKYTNKYQFGNVFSSSLDNNQNLEYSPEEIVRSDFGLYRDRIILSYLEFAYKNANMLKTLEDLLIPLRFSRSISRRVFNVDVGDLPNKRAQEVMTDIQNKFRYKKFYNNETGEISNQQHITSMVEDYWFANRSGAKGTTVDTIDETGNLGELNDVLYFYKKLYKSLNIPSNRIDINMEGNKDFNFDSTETSLEELKFFTFVNRIRNVYCEFFKKILMREVISTNIMSEKEWKEREHDINVVFTHENNFIDNWNTSNFANKVETFKNMLEIAGKVFPVEYLYEKVFKMNANDVKELMEQIKKESKDKNFADFYKADDEGGGF